MELIKSAKYLGLVESFGEFYPDASWQRRMVHWFRTVRTDIPTGKAWDFVAMLKAIYAQEGRVCGREEGGRRRHEASRSRMAFPREHGTQIQTDNPLERIMREIGVGQTSRAPFPGDTSALMLVAARLRYMVGTRWGTRKYLDMTLFAEHRSEKTFENHAQQNGEFKLPHSLN